MEPVLEFAGRSVTVMGLGRFGGGIGVTRFLARQGARVTVTDRADADLLADSIAQIRPFIDSGAVELHLGDHRIEDFIVTDLVVATPAVPKPWRNEFLHAAGAAGVPVTTEIGLVARSLGDRSRIVGVTGSAGKSTTTAMVAHAIGAALREHNDHRRCHLGGNIGGSLLDQLDDIAPDDFIALELSSAMLHWLDKDRWSPGVAVVTNLSENHLDWHGDLAHYERSKRAILAHQLPGDIALLPEPLAEWASLARADVEIVRPGELAADLAGVTLSIPGAHNRANAQLASRAAAAALRRAGVEVSANECAYALATFGALPHRLELVGEFAGARAYNDSKSTTPESAVRAIEALLDDAAQRGLPAPAIHLICGGSDKGADYAPLAQAARRCASVLTIGLTGPAIARSMEVAGVGSTSCGDLPTAIHEAAQRAAAGGVILLSPACASYDQFNSYEERGDAFRELILAELSHRSESEKNPNKALT